MTTPTSIRTARPSASVVAGGGDPGSLVATTDDDSILAAQLSAQYQKAIGGLREVLIFGAMLMRLRDTLSACGQGVSARGKPITGNGIAGEGLKTWLAENCPEISRPTAYRHLAIAEQIQTEYLSLVGARTAKAYTLPDLVAADPDDLPEHARAKQLELFDYVSGTSQRSWLDRIAPRRSDHTPGGNTYDRHDTDGHLVKGKGAPKSDTTRAADAAELANAILDDIDRFFNVGHATDLTADGRRTMIAALKDAARKLALIAD